MKITKTDPGAQFAYSIGTKIEVTRCLNEFEGDCPCADRSLRYKYNSCLADLEGNELPGEMKKAPNWCPAKIGIKIFLQRS